jgi:hypothetical protein
MRCHAGSGLRRVIVAGAALLLALSQAVAAADRCLVERLAGHHESLAAVAVDHHYGAPDAHCAVDLANDPQAPGTEPKRDTPAPDSGLTLTARWSSAPRVTAQAARLDAPRAGLPRTLQFHCLRL